MIIAKNLKGSTGAVKDICHLHDGYTVSCGMDRFLRLFNYKTNEDLPQIYLKNKLNIIFPYEVEINKESEDEDEEDEFVDDEENEFIDDSQISDYDSEECKEVYDEESEEVEEIKPKQISKKK